MGVEMDGDFASRAASSWFCWVSPSLLLRHSMSSPVANDPTKRAQLKKSTMVTVPTLPANIHHVLFSSPSFSPVASAILALPDCKDDMAAGNIQWKSFEDGFPNLMIENVENVRGRDIVFLADFLNHVEMFAQLSGPLSQIRFLIVCGYTSFLLVFFCDKPNSYYMHTAHPVVVLWLRHEIVADAPLLTSCVVMQSSIAFPNTSPDLLRSSYHTFPLEQWRESTRFAILVFGALVFVLTGCRKGKSRRHTRWRLFYRRSLSLILAPLEL
jgi:hypothetical protein